MNRFSKLIGVIASIAVIVCILTTCSLEDEDKGRTVTFSLDKKDNYSFTITVEGAKWRNFTYDVYEAGYLVEFSNPLLNIVDEQNKETWYNFWGAFPFENWKRTSDTVITATFVKGYTPKGRMVIEFQSSPDSLYFRDTAMDLLDGGEDSDNYKVNPAKSRIVWQ